MADSSLWKQIVEASPWPVCAFDLDYRLIAFNQAHVDAVFRAYGRRSELGEVFPDFFLPEQAPVIRGFMARALAGETFTVMGDFGDPDRTVPHWELRYTPLHDGEGAIIGAFHEAKDVTDRLKLEELLGEARLHFAATAGRIGLWELDLTTWRLATSAVCKAVFGRDPDAPFTYDDLRDAVHVDDRERMRDAVEAAIREGVDYDIEYRICKPGGELGWAQVRAQVHADGGRQPTMAGISVDITGRKRGERLADALRRLGDLIRDLADPDELAFAAAELLGRTLEVDRAGYGLVDTAAETITIARDWNAPGVQSLAGVLNFREFGSYIENLKRNETVLVSDARTDPRTADTAAALEGITARAFINMPVTEQGGLVALLYVNHGDARKWPEDELAFFKEVAERIRSATERRRAEISFAALAASLEAQVQERTQALMVAEEALRQAQKMEAVGQLTGGIAHDFNNLLAAIMGSLELAERRRQEGRVEALPRYLDAARQSAERATALTQRLLAFSRRQQLDPRPLDLNRLIVGMEDLIRRTTGPTIAVEVVGAIGLWPSMIDPNQLENALLNLCINARDAMPDGGRITIETANKWLDASAGKDRDLAPGQYVSLCVTDTGMGMTPEVVARAFDPFFTTKPLGQGTGLGLSMIYGFVRQSNGQVRVYSEVGQGTTMCLYFPRYTGDLSSEEHGPPSEPAHEGGHGETVLVVDDEEVVRMLVVDILQEAGYRILEAGDGPSGLKHLQSAARIDLLITDVGLPGGMNGRQVADAGRQIRPDLKVLFVTGYAENAVVANGHIDPGMQIITKPFAVDALAAKVREMIDAAAR